MNSLSIPPLRSLVFCILVVFALAIWGDTKSLAKREPKTAVATSPAPAGDYIITGKVYWANGTPAANALVTMTGSQTGTTTSNAAGIFTFVLPAINCFVGSHAVDFHATMPDPSCEPSHVRQDFCAFGLCGFFVGCGSGGAVNGGEIHLGSCNSSGQPTPTPTPVPDDRTVKPIPYPSPVPTDSGYYATSPNSAFSQTVPRSGGPILRTVDVHRAVGDLNADDTLQNASELVNNGVVSRFATLRIPAYDVDYSAGERDHILFNGVEIGPQNSKAYLTGKDKTWQLSEYQIPIELVRFGRRDTTPLSPGHTTREPPEPGQNEVKILVDEGNGAAHWRVAVGNPKIEFEALYPVVMVHGNGSCGGFFAGDWLCKGTPIAPDRWFIRPFIDQRIPFDNSIAMEAAPIEVNAGKLLSGDRSIQKIADEWGARHVHIIAHSKGGIDVRGFLTGLPGEDEPASLGVVSFTTLSTPHLGSVGADYQDTVSKLIKTRKLDQEDLDTIAASDSRFHVLMTLALETDPGKPNLRVDSMRGFNEWNVPALPLRSNVDGQSKKVFYYALGADADLIFDLERPWDGEKYHPERYLPVITDGTFGSSWETEGMPHIPPIIPRLEGMAYTMEYRMFGTVREAVVGRGLVPGLMFPRPIPNVHEIKEPCWFQLSDFAVTQASALAEQDPCDWPNPNPNPLLPFWRTDFIKANHATLSTAQHALKVIEWIHLSQPMPQ